MRRRMLSAIALKKFIYLIFSSNTEGKKRMKASRYILIGIAVCAFGALGYSKFKSYDLNGDLRKTEIVTDEVESGVAKEEIPSEQKQIALKAVNQTQDAPVGKNTQESIKNEEPKDKSFVKISDIMLSDEEIKKEKHAELIERFSKLHKRQNMTFRVDSETKKIYLALDGINYREGESLKYNKMVKVSKSTLECKDNSLPDYKMVLTNSDLNMKIVDFSIPFTENYKLSFLFDSITLNAENYEDILIPGEEVVEGFTLISIEETEGDLMQYSFKCGDRVINLHYEELFEIGKPRG